MAMEMRDRVAVMTVAGTHAGELGDSDAVTARLARWAAAHYGPRAVVSGVAPMPGHAGISFGFDVTADSGAEQLVIRIAPPGVRRRGSADVLHQVPVLRSARVHGVPTPDVRWWGDDERWFGAPYFVVERLAGSVLDCWAPQSPASEAVASLFGQATAALAKVHRIDWARRLPGWSVPRTLDDEIETWRPVLLKGGDAGWTERAMRLHDLLVRHRPDEPDPSVVHGDFCSNNWLTDGDRLVGVVDWELAEVGPPLLDVAWLMMMYDPESWAAPRRAWMDWAPSLADIAEGYTTAGGRPLDDLGWYRALAAWRMASITAFNVRLHRTGRRNDPVWEVFAASFDALVRRGCELVLSPEAAKI